MRAARRRRRRGRGQSLVEFALCAPIVFAILFGVINGGLFMYAKNAVARATNVGSVTMAAEGKAQTVDLDTLTAMQKAGVGANSLVGVQSVEFARVQYSAGCQCYQVVTGASSGCSDASGNTDCRNTYDISGNALWSYNSTSCPSSDPNYTWHCPPWLPANRDVSASGANMVRITVHYTFTFPATGKSFTSDAVNVFRLEPKQL